MADLVVPQGKSIFGPVRHSSLALGTHQQRLIIVSASAKHAVFLRLLIQHPLYTRRQPQGWEGVPDDSAQFTLPVEVYRQPPETYGLQSYSIC
jgi:hypothetical protein